MKQNSLQGVSITGPDNNRVQKPVSDWTWTSGSKLKYNNPFGGTY